MSATFLGQSTALLLLCRVVGYPLALLSSVVLARGLGVDGLGVYAYTMGVTALFGLVPNLGLNPVITQTISQNPQAAGSMLKIGMRAQVLLSASTFCAVTGFAWSLPGQPVPLEYVSLAAAQMVVGTLCWPYLAVLAGHMRYDRVAFVEFVSTVMGTALLLVAIMTGGGIVAVLLAHLLAAGISVTITRRTALPFLTPESLPELTVCGLIRQAIPFGILGVVQSFYARIDVILLGQIASNYALGLYNVAYKPVNMLVSLGNTVASPIFPLMAQAGPRKTPEALVRVLRYLLVVSPAMAIVSTGLAGPIIQALYGSTYTTAAPIFALLAWSAAANWLYVPASMVLQARNQEHCWMACLVMGLILNGGANLLLIPRWGAFGAAVATVISETALLLAGVMILWRKMGIHLHLLPLLGSLGSTTVSVATLWALWGQGSVTATSTAFAAYCVSVLLFRIITLADVRLVIGWMRAATIGERQG